MAELAVEAEAEESPPQFGTRYLRYLAGAVLLITLFERSDLLPAYAVPLIAALAGAFAVGGLLIAYRAAAADDPQAWQAPSRYLLPLMAVAVGAGLAYLSPDWRLAAFSQAMMAGVIFAGGYVNLASFKGEERPGHAFLHDAAVIVILLGAFLAILGGVPNLLAKMVLIFAITFVAAYEGFVPVVKGENEAVFHSQTVAVITTAIAFALVFGNVQIQGYVAVILLLAWYVERGVIVHVLSRTMTRNIVVEYIVLAVISIVLVANALLNH